ncbi:divalent-cation tolerance protein CutA [Gloeothece verrucosa]|uniref:CutA1 divalent ion tolerance protein n=1 Tax=Gloeothece verrucosa (strain PCC 7822) TaxID=497965 RepID=E0UIV1_GLOV7|nr:divalent-cation tolerance protein CutA [Gloeothece verrucosa]ADN13410.1 CutA1 divalent ion tolerance protein [Gloeothece verrucosa PCC 7822]
MKLYYVTLNTTEEARQIGRILIEKKLAVCVNWFPISCSYRWQGEIIEEPEVVLIIKTRSGYRSLIEKIIQKNISYTNFIAEISPSYVNQSFLDWLNLEVPLFPHQEVKIDA